MPSLQATREDAKDILAGGDIMRISKEVKESGLGDLEADWREIERLRQLSTTERAKQLLQQQQQQGLARRPGLMKRPGVQRVPPQRSLGVERVDELLDPDLKRALDAQRTADVGVGT
jgi:hypothetical protein